MSQLPGAPKFDFSLSSAKDLLNSAAEKVKGFNLENSFKSLLGIKVVPSKDVTLSKVSTTSAAQEVQTLKKGQTAREDNSDVIVKLVSSYNGFVVTFKVTPDIAESRAVTYEEVQVVHHPGAVVKYKTTGNRSWSISNAKLISRTSAEADINQSHLNTIRGWTMPFYGYGTEEYDAAALGAPPEVLTFSAYGDANIGPLPVVLESYDWNWPSDVDYIPTSDGDPFPVIINISLKLKESWSPRQFSSFSLIDYYNGDLLNAYDVDNIPASPPPKPEAQIVDKPSPTIAPSSPISESQAAAAEPKIALPTPRPQPFKGGGGQFGGGGANGEWDMRGFQAMVRNIDNSTEIKPSTNPGNTHVY